MALDHYKGKKRNYNRAAEVGKLLRVLQRNNELVLAEDLNDQGAMWLVRAALRRPWPRSERARGIARIRTYEG